MSEKLHSASDVRVQVWVPRRCPRSTAYIVCQRLCEEIFVHSGPIRNRIARVCILWEEVLNCGANRPPGERPLRALIGPTLRANDRSSVTLAHDPWRSGSRVQPSEDPRCAPAR
jgi:hypothetical protein